MRRPTARGALPDGRDAEGVEADIALSTRFSAYGYSVEWEKPFKFLWQSEEDIAEKPGTCTHRVELELDVQLIRIGNSAGRGGESCRDDFRAFASRRAGE